MKPTLLIFRAVEELYPINNRHVFFYKMDRFYAHYFNIKIIDYECDYKEIVDKLKPDLCVFQFNAFQTNIVRNVKGENSVPKIGVGIIDGSDVKRGVFYRLLNNIGASYYFFVETTIGSTFPDLKDQIFYLPHFIDADINNDYGLEKNIPVLITGNQDYPFYGWRAEVNKQILNHFPAVWYRHPGYDPQKKIPELLRIQGESYFKTINASYIVPTCGSFKHSLIMKHLEIPGSKACLVCEESETVKMHGFKHMENCVFAKPSEIVDKLNYLFENPDELQRITDNGYEFVHANHTHRHRPQLLQLFDLLKKKKPTQKIIQPDILGDLELVDEISPRETIHIQVSDEIEWIGQIDRDIANKKYKQGEKECKRIIEIADYIHDAKLRLYLIHMLNGRIRYGAKSLRTLIKHSTKYPVIIDPIDHALLIIHFLVENDIKKAIYYSKIGLTKRRPETDYARLLAFKLGGEKDLFNSLRREVMTTGKRKDIKTIYYFYTDEFDFFDMLEKIVKKNIRHSSLKYFRFEHFLDDVQDSNDCETKLESIEESCNNEILLEDLKLLDIDIPMTEKMKRKLQDGLNTILK